MDKQISQKTFDDVVRENMADFDMEASEALQDAIQQFESQGINLALIVKDASHYHSNNQAQDHRVISAFKQLASALEETPLNFSDIQDILRTIREECDSDKACRFLAGSNGSYPVLYKALVSFKEDPEKINVVLLTFCSLVNGFPDLIDSDGMDLLVSLLKDYHDATDTLELIIRSIRLNCIKHEKNRQEFTSRKLITILSELLLAHKTEAAIIREICSCLRTLTLDDDVRILFGSAYDNAKAMVSEGDALKALLQLCEENKENTSVLAELFLTLSCIVVRDEFCKDVMDRGGVQLIIDACRNGINDKTVVRQAMIVLKALAGNDDVKHEIAKLGGIELVVEAMAKFQNNAPVAEAGCRVLTTITLRNVENGLRVVQCQGHEQIVQVMKLHPQDVGVQKHSCMALRNIVSRSKELSDHILSLGAESLLNNLINSHKEIEDEAKAALRDLGCKVELREFWKGEMGKLQ